MRDPGYRPRQTERGWGVVDSDQRWCLLDQYAEIGPIRFVEIDYESLIITLSNESRWVAAVRHEAGGPWGCFKLEGRAGEMVMDFRWDDPEEMLQAVVPQPGEVWSAEK